MDYTVIMRDAILLLFITFYYFIFLLHFYFSLSFYDNCFQFWKQCNAYIREHFKRVTCQVLQSSFLTILFYIVKLVSAKFRIK